MLGLLLALPLGFAVEEPVPVRVDLRVELLTLVLRRITASEFDQPAGSRPAHARAGRSPWRCAASVPRAVAQGESVDFVIRYAGFD